MGQYMMVRVNQAQLSVYTACVKPGSKERTQREPTHVNTEPGRRWCCQESERQVPLWGHLWWRGQEEGPLGSLEMFSPVGWVLVTWVGPCGEIR